MKKTLLAVALALATSFQPSAASAGEHDRGSVANATFTSEVVDGGPIDFREEFDNETPVVYYYSELLGLAGQTVQHRWTRDGKLMQEVPIQVTRARQPAWSKTVMQPEWTGAWTVEVVDEGGRVLDRSGFAYNPPL